jgi:pimeloyl-ACP methyl ester carboxylesterase
MLQQKTLCGFFRLRRQNLAETLQTKASPDLALESHFITLTSGEKIHYVEAGDPNAPALILMHGFLTSLNDWAYNIEPLAKLAHRRVIAFDWVGFGQSDKLDRAYSLYYFADITRELATKLGVKEFDLIGHSMGGKHALAFAVMYPQYLCKLVLVDTDGFVKDPWWTNHTKGLFKPVGNITSSMLSKTWFLRQFAKTVYFDPKFYPSVERLKQGAEFYRREDALAAVRAMNHSYPSLSLKLTGLRERLSELKVPTLIIWGMQDKILPVSLAYIAQNEIPNSNLYIFDRCGHLPQVEYADEFNQMVAKFLATGYKDENFNTDRHG